MQWEYTGMRKNSWSAIYSWFCSRVFCTFHVNLSWFFPLPFSSLNIYEWYFSFNPFMHLPCLQLLYALFPIPKGFKGTNLVQATVQPYDQSRLKFISYGVDVQRKVLFSLWPLKGCSLTIVKSWPRSSQPLMIRAFWIWYFHTVI